MNDKLNSDDLKKKIRFWAKELGFNAIGISDTKLQAQKKNYHDWLANNFHGEMSYLERHKEFKFHPEKLMEQTKTIIACRLDYLPMQENLLQMLKNKKQAYVSRYALGRDYHKVLKKKLKQLCLKIEAQDHHEGIKTRIFTDSAPVLEVGVAEKAGLGWRGKHTLLLNKNHGSWFFLGEIYINVKLPVDSATSNHCGSCSACIDICPTKAIIAPYKLDARRCISYLTIEHKTSIPLEFRKAIGNRIYGCDDCQIICPWNKYAKITKENDFHVRNNLHQLSLEDCFKFSEAEFKQFFSGSAIYRIGHERWLRNVAIGLGNAPKSHTILTLLKKRLPSTSALVQEHILWAIEQHK